MAFFTYILASGRKRDALHRVHPLARRLWDHKTGSIPGFTAKYGVKMLVWYEQHETRAAAFRRERQIKEWKRLWKLELIERFNPGWRDLYETYHP